jgi:hypothetical protein
MAQYVWIQKQNIGPTPRIRHAMEYDRKKKQVLLFGGLTWVKVNNVTQPMALTDTWSWDGAFWTQVSDMGPTYGLENLRIPRRSLAMAYDVPQELMVLYFEGSTWLWDGKYWIQAADTGPERIMEEHEIGLAFFPRTGKIYSHGNMEMGTWSWDGNKWLQVADNGPNGSLQAVVCEEHRERLLLFEGETGVTWEFNADVWQAVTSIGPGKGTDLQMTYVNNRIIAFANQVRESSIQARGTWEWANNQWKQVEDLGPGRRIDFALAGNVDNDSIVLFGGSKSLSEQEAPLGDTWEYAMYPPVS